MDANIQVAASNLRRAIDNFNRHIGELRGMTSVHHQQGDQEKRSLHDQIRQNEIRLNRSDISDQEKQSLAHHIQELHILHNKVDERIGHRVREIEQEIRDIEQQIAKLTHIANSLESW